MCVTYIVIYNNVYYKHASQIHIPQSQQTFKNIGDMLIFYCH